MHVAHMKYFTRHSLWQI